MTPISITQRFRSNEIIITDDRIGANEDIGLLEAGVGLGKGLLQGARITLGIARDNFGKRSDQIAASEGI